MSTEPMAAAKVFNGKFSGPKNWGELGEIHREEWANLIEIAPCPHLEAVWWWAPSTFFFGPELSGIILHGASWHFTVTTCVVVTLASEFYEISFNKTIASRHPIEKRHGIWKTILSTGFAMHVPSKHHSKKGPLQGPFEVRTFIAHPSNSTRISLSNHGSGQMK